MNPRRLARPAPLAALLLAFAALLAIVRPPAHATVAQRTRLTVQIQHVFDDKPLEFDDVRLMNRAGNLLSVTRLSYLLSDFALIRADGTRVALPDRAVWLSPSAGRNVFDLSDVPVGDYAGLAFRVGLPPATNHANPAVYPANHPLNPVVNGLHWGWQGGYVFFAIEGRYEQAGNRLGGYSFHLGTDADPMRVTLRHPLTVAPNRALALRLDVARVFDVAHVVAIRPNGGDSTHSAPADTLATQLKANVAHAFALVGTMPLMHAAPTTAPIVRAIPKGATPFVLPIPAHFPQPALPADNPLTIEGIALGKRLFRDTCLSGNNRQSCASCHQEAAAFADRGHAFSVGIDGKAGRRNAMPLFNLAWSRAFTWDGRRSRLRDQAVSPIQDIREMHQTLPQTLRKLAADSAYPRQFARAFGSPGVTSERLGLAIEQYLLTIISADSKFDRALRGEATFTDEEKQGLLLFISEYNPANGQRGADCFHCHGGNLFTDYQFKNNGLFETVGDWGREEVTGRPADRDRFKTPTLRNVELTAPYMHDGRFKTLEEVVEHYNSGVHRTDTLDPNIAKHPDNGLQLSDSDKKALVAFLKTLTGERFRVGR